MNDRRPTYIMALFLGAFILAGCTGLQPQAAYERTPDGRILVDLAGPDRQPNAQLAGGAVTTAGFGTVPAVDNFGNDLHASTGFEEAMIVVDYSGSQTAEAQARQDEITKLQEERTAAAIAGRWDLADRVAGRIVELTEAIKGEAPSDSNRGSFRMAVRVKAKDGVAGVVTSVGSALATMQGKLREAGPTASQEAAGAAETPTPPEDTSKPLPGPPPSPGEALDGSIAPIAGAGARVAALRGEALQEEMIRRREAFKRMTRSQE